MDDLPEIRRMPEALRCASVDLGAELAASGFSSWVVGGAVRDQVLGRTPTDVDIATDATPEEVEACFGETVPLGKRFGTVLVMRGGLGIEVTTLRSESGYADARRPESVTYGTSVAVDATRRDFTCNAMYLDTQNGEFLDPVHGLADTKSAVLRAVGDAASRFEEDGLRIVRLARLAAVLGMKPEAGTITGARLSRASLRGVSGERLFAELERGFASGRGASMLRWLGEIEVVEELYPGFTSGAGARGAALCREWPGEPGLLEGLLLFLDPDPGGGSLGERTARSKLATSSLDSLKVPRGITRSWTACWRLAGELESAAERSVERGDLRLWMREDSWETASALALLTVEAESERGLCIRAWREERQSLSEEELFPVPWIEAATLSEAGVEPGAIYGELLATALRMQLSGEFADKDAAMSWLHQQI